MHPDVKGFLRKNMHAQQVIFVEYLSKHILLEKNEILNH